MIMDGIVVINDHNDDIFIINDPTDDIVIINDHNDDIVIHNDNIVIINHDLLQFSVKQPAQNIIDIKDGYRSKQKR